MSELTTSDYPGFLMEIKSRIRSAQYQALRAANKELVSLYWDLGQSIHQKQEALGWGKAVVQTLANDLQFEFPGRNGFSARNLWCMSQFYEEYRKRPILQPLVAEISWAKNMVINKRIKYSLSHGNPGERAGVRGLRSRVVRPLTPNPSPRLQGEGSKNFNRESEPCDAPSSWNDSKPFERGLLA